MLSSKEVACIDQQFKRKLQSIIKLSTNSPASLVHFIAGSLPGTAILHLKQISLFSMICHLPGDPLYVYAQQVLVTSSCSTSWFVQLRDLHLMYQLPHPLQLLQNPPAKLVFKKLAKSRVLDFWEKKLRDEGCLLPSLTYFNPNFMSLTNPHKIWTPAGNKPYEVAKARIQLLFLSSQYPCAKLTRHWSVENPQGICTFPLCQDHNLVESPEHILIHCPAYISTRLSMVLLCYKQKDPISHFLISKLLFTSNMMQLLLDCSALPLVIHNAQLHGEQVYNNLFYLSRTWCFALHRERMKRLNKWKFR